MSVLKRYWARLYCKGVFSPAFPLPSIIVGQGKLASFGFDGQVQRNSQADCKVCFREVFSRKSKINECDVLKPAGTYTVPPGCQCNAEKKLTSFGTWCSGLSNWRFWRWDEDPEPYNRAAEISAASSLSDQPLLSDVENYASQLCSGCQGHQVKIDTCCATVKERGTFQGTKTLLDGIHNGDPRFGGWEDWAPPTSDICGGQPFVQRKRLVGCRPCSAVATLDKKTGVWWSLETRPAVGTAAAVDVWPHPYGKSISNALNGWNPESGTPPSTGWKTTDPAGNPYAEDNPDTPLFDESTHLGVCYPGTMKWSVPANYSDTDEPDCVYYADGTSSCDPPKDPCESASGPDCASAIPSLNYIPLPAPAYGKCASLIAYKAQSALFNFTLSKTYKVKYKVISLSPVQTGGFGGGFFDVPSYGAPQAPDNGIFLGRLKNVFGWGWASLGGVGSSDRFIYIGYDVEEVSWSMEKTQGTYQWQSNQLVLPTSLYTDMESKGVTQSGYFPAEWKVPFPSEQQIKGMAQYRVPYLMNSDLQDKIKDKIHATAFLVPGGFTGGWKAQLVNEATANGVNNLDSVSLSPGESTLNPIEIGKTGNISFGGNSLVKLCLSELAAGFNNAAYMKVPGIRAPGSTQLSPCPDSCCCGKANCVSCSVSWGGGSFADGEFYGYSNPDKLVKGVSLTSRIVSGWQGQEGFQFGMGTWQALDWNNSKTSTRIVWTQ